MLSQEIRKIIQGALAEDIGSGDVTSVPTIPPTTAISGQFLVKAEGVIAGLEIVGEVFRQVDSGIIYEQLVEDGTQVSYGDVVARVTGKGPWILVAERVALNFLQRMSGIASLTQQYVQAVAGTEARILDTRKTVPGLRSLDKLAVKLGGGTNHRIGLYDMVLIKDNHIEATGSIENAVARIRDQVAGLKIEVEVESLKQFDRALALGVDRIMLDNMDADTMREAVSRAQGRVELEASGGINLDTVRAAAETGVDFISVGALTHSVMALDISLEAKLELEV